MKKLKYLLTILLVSSSLNLSFAQGGVDDDGDYCPECPPTPANGPGRTPIDDYAGVLIITALTIAGAIYYNKEKLSIKNK